jgi:spore coat polysaccharide biosynthesis protein SpsF (cytidylyltransferase family)
VKSKIVGIVQARMGSSRFPGKTLERIGKWSIIELVLRRANQSKSVSDIVLATSTNPLDDILERHVAELGFPVSRGSESDVLARFYEAAKKLRPSNLVRITGDCPFISPGLIDLAVQEFTRRGVDYLVLSIGRKKELAFPRGFDVEVFKYESLREAATQATKRYEREHVTPYIYTHPDLFTISYLHPPPELSRPNYRVCVDTPKDLQVLLKIHEAFGEDLIDASYEDLIMFLDRKW